MHDGSCDAPGFVRCTEKGTVLDYTVTQSLPFVEKLLHFDLLESTNLTAKKGAELPKKGIIVIVADRQSSGRGQRSNRFFSEVEGGLWVSLITHLPDISDHFFYNRALCLAICESTATGVPSPVSIKWPNDIYIGTKKTCGILLETVPSQPGFLVIGFGLNVNVSTAEFPEELRSTAISLSQASGHAWDLPELLTSILRHYHRNVGCAVDSLHSAYSSRLYGLNATARIKETEGVFGGVEIDGRACLHTRSGVKHFTSGPMKFPGNRENSKGSSRA